MFAIYMVSEANLFSGREEMEGRAKMLKDLRAIGKLNVGKECLMELDARLGELEGRIAIGDEITNAKWTRERKKCALERKT